MSAMSPLRCSAIEPLDTTLFRLLMQEQQQFVFRAGEHDGLSVGRDRLAQQVDSDPVAAQQVVDGKHLAPDDGVDAHAQFRQMEGLGQIVVGADFKSFDLVVHRVFGRHDDDPHRIFLFADGTQMSSPFPPGSIRSSNTQS